MNNTHDPKTAEDHAPTPATDEAAATVAKIRDLIARSSLGTPGAMELRERTTPEMSALVRQLSDLRNRVVHSHSLFRLTPQDIVDLMWVADQCEMLGLDETARWAFGEVAAANLERIANSLAKQGQHADAKTWRARANTLHAVETLHAEHG